MELFLFASISRLVITWRKVRMAFHYYFTLGNFWLCLPGSDLWSPSQEKQRRFVCSDGSSMPALLGFSRLSFFFAVISQNKLGASGLAAAKLLLFFHLRVGFSLFFMLWSPIPATIRVAYITYLWASATVSIIAVKISCLYGSDPSGWKNCILLYYDHSYNGVCSVWISLWV